MMATEKNNLVGVRKRFSWKRKKKKKNQEICHASTGRSRLEHIMVVDFLTVRSWTWVWYNHEKEDKLKGKTGRTK